MEPRTRAQLEAGLDHVRASPRDDGRLEAIAVRPERDARRVLDSCRLDPVHGAEGDRWALGLPSPPLPGMSEQHTQLTLMNARAADLVAGSRDRWALAGDQLYVDFSLAEDHLHPGDRLRIGATAVLEITPQPHNGCRKFSARFGIDATEFVNSTEGKRLHLRGVCARVVTAGVVRPGDAIAKVT